MAEFPTNDKHKNVAVRMCYVKQNVITLFFNQNVNSVVTF